MDEFQRRLENLRADMYEIRRLHADPQVRALVGIAEGLALLAEAVRQPERQRASLTHQPHERDT